MIGADAKQRKEAYNLAGQKQKLPTIKEMTIKSKRSQASKKRADANKARINADLTDWVMKRKAAKIKVAVQNNRQAADKLQSLCKAMTDLEDILKTAEEKEKEEQCKKVKEISTLKDNIQSLLSQLHTAPFEGLADQLRDIKDPSKHQRITKELRAKAIMLEEMAAQLDKKMVEEKKVSEPKKITPEQQKQQAEIKAAVEIHQKAASKLVEVGKAISELNEIPSESVVFGPEAKGLTTLKEKIVDSRTEITTLKEKIAGIFEQLREMQTAPMHHRHAEVFRKLQDVEDHPPSRYPAIAESLQAMAVKIQNEEPQKSELADEDEQKIHQDEIQATDHRDKAAVHETAASKLEELGKAMIELEKIDPTLKEMGEKEDDSDKGIENKNTSSEDPPSPSLPSLSGLEATKLEEEIDTTLKEKEEKEDDADLKLHLQTAAIAQLDFSERPKATMLQKEIAKLKLYLQTAAIAQLDFREKNLPGLSDWKKELPPSEYQTRAADFLAKADQFALMKVQKTEKSELMDNCADQQCAEQVVQQRNNADTLERDADALMSSAAALEKHPDVPVSGASSEPTQDQKAWFPGAGKPFLTDGDGGGSPEEAGGCLKKCRDKCNNCRQGVSGRLRGCLNKCRDGLIRWMCGWQICAEGSRLESCYRSLTEWLRTNIPKAVKNAVEFVLPPVVDFKKALEVSLLETLRTLDSSYATDFVGANESAGEEMKEDKSADVKGRLYDFWLADVKGAGDQDDKTTMWSLVCGKKKHQTDEEEKLEQDVKKIKIALVIRTCEAQVSIMILQFLFTVGVRYAVLWSSGETAGEALVNSYTTTFLERSIISFASTLVGKALHAQSSLQAHLHGHLFHELQAQLYQFWSIL